MVLLSIVYDSQLFGGVTNHKIKMDQKKDKKPEIFWTSLEVCMIQVTDLLEDLTVI